MERIGHILQKENDMGLSIKIGRNSGKSFGEFSETLNPGPYHAEFKGYEEGEQASYKDGDVMEPCVVLNFEIELGDGEPIEVNRKVKPIVSASGRKSNMTKAIEGMLGSDIPAEVLADETDTELWNLLDSFIGQVFIITVTNKKSKNDKEYSRWEAINKKQTPGRRSASTESQPTTTATAEAKVAPANLGEPTSIEDDDLPF